MQYRLTTPPAAVKNFDPFKCFQKLQKITNGMTASIRPDEWGVVSNWPMDAMLQCRSHNSKQQEKCPYQVP